jgi:hypothetical protein
MTQKFSINKSRALLQQQWDYLLEIPLKNQMRFLRNSFFTIGVSILLYTVLILFTKADNYVIAKGVFAMMLALALIAIIFYSLLIAVIKYKKKKQIQIFLSSVTDEQLSYDVEIDEEKVKISGYVMMELPWTEFTSFRIYKDNLYILNAAELLSSLYWSKEEIGEERYHNLIDFLHKKGIHQVL